MLGIRGLTDFCDGLALFTDVLDFSGFTFGLGLVGELLFFDF